MSLREWVLGAGILLVGLGLFLVIQPGLAGLSLPARSPAVVAAVALLAAGLRGAGWYRRDREPPLIEAHAEPAGSRVPGDDVDTLLARVPSITSSAGDRRALKSRQDLRSVALDVLVAYRGLDRETARQQLDAGAWTDDPMAAEFFAKLDGTSAPLSESVAESIRDGSPFERRAEAAVTELAAITEEGDA